MISLIRAVLSFAESHPALVADLLRFISVVVSGKDPAQTLRAAEAAAAREAIRQ